jgi:hypothetical protein
VFTEVQKDFKLLLHITLAVYCHSVKEYQINYLVISCPGCLRQHFMLVQKPLTMFYFFHLQKVLKAAGLFAGSIFLMRTQGDNMVI